MRILMLAQFYPPIIGGEERFVRDFSAALVERGHSVAVATLLQPSMPEFSLDGEVRVYRIRSSTQRLPWLHSSADRRHAPPFPDPEVTLGLRRVRAKERPDIVHAHNWMVYSYLPLKLLHGIPLVVTLHDYSLVCATKKRMFRGTVCTGPQILKCLECSGAHYGAAKGPGIAAANWLFGNAERLLVDRFLPESHAVADGNSLPGGRARYAVLPVFAANSITERRAVAGPHLAQLPTEEFLLFVGAFGSYKGVDVLFQAYALLRNAPPLVVIGYNTSEYPVQTTNLPPNVTVLHNWPHEAVLEAFHRSMIALAPSVWAEPFGLVVVEAMAAGRPVVASRTGGLVDLVVDGETGLLVTPGDPEALRQAMQHLIDRPELRVRMGEASSRRVARFQASAVLPRIEQVYRQLLGKA